MALTFLAVTCGGGQYTRLAYGSANVAFKLREAGTGRLWGGQVPVGEDEETWAPDVENADFTTVEGKQPFSYNALSIGDGFWYMPEGEADVIMEVNRS